MAVIFLRTVIVFSVLLLLMRILGKRQLGELELSELVVSVLVADIAAIPIQDIGIPLMNSLLSILTLFCLELILSGLTQRFLRLKSALFGRPCFLMERGVINEKEMRRNRFSIDELTEQLRRQSITDLNEVDYAVLETDGTLNILLKAAHRPVTAGQMGLAEAEEGYPSLLINDGRILSGNLRKCGREERWLREECRKRGVSDPGEVYFFSFAPGGAVYFQAKEKRT